ncbi:MAG: branched-chain amino acid ABC transporter permease [Nitriliruptorales bacterium]|nr:branched-chain amino acid ABC transporter permease [Nitriliruptorales bacterium]
MTDFLQALISGLGVGSIYALLAVGFVIIYKSMQVISFAQPALLVTGAVMVSYLRFDFGLNFWIALPLAMVLTALLALVIERLALRPMIGKPVFVVAIITIGVDIAVRVVVNRFIGLGARQVGDPWGLTIRRLGAVVVQERYLWMMLITAVVVSLLFAFFKYSRVGLAMRAAAFDQETALAQGISVGQVFALSWAIAGALAALAGTLAGTRAGIDQQTWVLGLKALPAIILGGLDSVGGAVVGGLAVGVVEAMVSRYQGAYFPWLGQNFSLVSPYVLMLIVLMIRPYGLFGTPEVERV